MKVSYGFLILILSFLFLGCIENKVETTSSTESMNLGIFKVSELNNLPKTLELGNNTYLTLTSIDKKSISIYIENKGVEAVRINNGHFIFRDKDGRVVRNGVGGFRLVSSDGLKDEVWGGTSKYGDELWDSTLSGTLIAKKKVLFTVNVPLDLYETWEPRIEVSIMPIQ